ncbi:hypothetical protein L208DRAFT_1264773 [Tricholoma matsutake]|nr:hypothetical protein L208DRAFT_1264773 [Tricholoma matsutake 945]
MAGKTIEELKAAHKAAHEKKPPTTNTPKILVTVKDINGGGFTIMVDSDTTPSPTPEFAGLASNPIPTTSIDMLEYEGWVVLEEEPITTVNWKDHTTSHLVFEGSLLNQTCHSSVTTDNFPFIINSGAMVHISPIKSDFLTLHPIPS